MKMRSRALGLCLVLVAAVAGACVPPPENQPPVAHAAATPDHGDAPLEVQFSSSGSSDADGTIVAFAWDFGDGNDSSDPNPTHTYTSAGEYTATLTVTDNSGGSGADSVTITVTVAPDDPNGRYVASTGADVGDCATSADPCATVNYAVSQAVAGNTIYVSAGAYPEMVLVDKALTFKGANAGVPAGVEAGTRGPESIVKGFRNPGTFTGATPVGTTQIDVTIDGFRVDPQGDAAIIAASAQPLIWLRGGPTDGVRIVNNVLFGADSFVPNCSHTCTAMTDSAIITYSGTLLIEENHLENFRRPITVTQSLGAPATHGSVIDNVIINASARSIALGGVTRVQMPGATVSGNELSTTSTSGAGGVVVSNGSNQITGNTIQGHGTAVFIDICKKWVTRDNVVTGNTLTNNGYGIWTGLSQPGSACQHDGQPEVNAGDINGLVATDNNISGNTIRGIHIGLGSGWATYTPIYPDGPIDLTCNWWGDASGPTSTLNPGGTGDSLVAQNTGTATIEVIPFRTAPAPEGACDGGV